MGLRLNLSLDPQDKELLREWLREIKAARNDMRNVFMVTAMEFQTAFREYRQLMRDDRQRLVDKLTELEAKITTAGADAVAADDAGEEVEWRPVFDEMLAEIATLKPVIEQPAPAEPAVLENIQPVE